MDLRSLVGSQHGACGPRRDAHQTWTASGRCGADPTRAAHRRRVGDRFDSIRRTFRSDLRESSPQCAQSRRRCVRSSANLPPSPRAPQTSTSSSAVLSMIGQIARPRRGSRQHNRPRRSSVWSTGVTAPTAFGGLPPTSPETSATAVSRSLKTAADVVGTLRSESRWLNFQSVRGLLADPRKQARAQAILDDLAAALRSDELNKPLGAALAELTSRTAELITPPRRDWSR